MTTDEQHQLDYLNHQISQVHTDIRGYKQTLALADIATLLMIFFFLVAFYVADPFHLASYLIDKVNGSVWEMPIYTLLVGMAGIMSITISRLKRNHYEHKARYRNSGSVWKVAVVIMAFTVFSEIYNATGNQQHSQFAKAESSKSFEAISNKPINIDTGAANLANLPALQGKLAEAQSYLDGCKKTCGQWRAKVDSLQAQISAIESSQAQQASLASAAAAGAQTGMANAMKSLRDDYLHPFVKFIMAVFGLTAATAMVIIAGAVAITFERMHLSASENLADCYARLESLEQQRLAVQTQTPLPRPNPHSDALPNGSEAIRDTPPNTPTERPKLTIPKGLFDMQPVLSRFAANVANQHPSPALAATADHIQAAFNAPKPYLGSQEQQLPLPSFADFKARRDQFASPALSDQDSQPLPLPNPHPNALPNGSEAIRDSHPEQPSADELVADPSNFALLAGIVRHPKFDATVLDLATGVIGCSQSAMKKAHAIGGDTTKWIMVILEAFEVVSEPKANQQGKRELLTALTPEQAQTILTDIKTSILGNNP